VAVVAGGAGPVVLTMSITTTVPDPDPGDNTTSATLPVA